MKTLDLHNRLADVYLSLMRNFRIEVQLDFIAKLSNVIKTKKINTHSVDYYCGIWQSENSAEEIISEIRSSRTFHREIEQF